MNKELLAEKPDITLGFYRYVIYDNGDKKFLQLRLDEISTDNDGIETSKIETEIRNYGKSINATSCDIYQVESKDENPKKLKSMSL